MWDKIIKYWDEIIAKLISGVPVDKVVSDSRISQFYYERRIEERFYFEERPTSSSSTDETFFSTSKKNKFGTLSTAHERLTCSNSSIETLENGMKCVQR